MDLLKMDTHTVVYEESILRDPYSLPHWLNYLEFIATTDNKPKQKHDKISNATTQSHADNTNVTSSNTAAVADPQQLAARWIIFERAVRVLPGSYKLWMKYIRERIINNVFERCLVHLHKMPVVWRTYLDFLIPQFKLTRIRRTFDRMLTAIAVTQHEKFVWPAYLKWACSCGVAETGIRVFRRYLKVHPLAVEDYIKFLKRSGRLEEAALELTKLVNDENFVSQRGKSKHDLWTDLLHLLVRNPTKMSKSQLLNVDAIIRSGINRFAHEVGRLWTNLADYYIRLGQFEKARDIYEEAINEVNTVKDFSLVFDAYAKFEESLLNAKMQEVEDANIDESDEKKSTDDDLHATNEEDDLILDWYAAEGVVTSAQPELLDLDIDMSMKRLDHLLNRRPLLLSSVILRQNPHHIAEWSHRISLFAHSPIEQINIYRQAFEAINPFLANNGKLERLWVQFAKFYESHQDLPNTRIIFAKASQVNFPRVDSLVHIWTEWVEFELRHGEYELALATIKKALTIPTGINRSQLGWSTSSKEKGNEDRQQTSQQKVYKSTKLWSLYADLEENFGTLESTKAVYDQMFYLKIITPNLVLSYAQLMWENKFFEDTFRIYEKAIGIFDYPHIYPIWMSYLHQFIERYGSGTGSQRKIERIRDLFEQALKVLPPNATETKKLYLLYAKYEEDQGLARRAMEIYSRACQAAPPADRYEVRRQTATSWEKLYIVYLTRCAHRFGLARSREIYESAIKNLPDSHVRPMALRYARLERTLGEIDRARAIYAYSSQFCDPRLEPGFWGTWSEFEVSHGNQETFKEMLRVKRSVLAHFAANSIIAQPTGLKLTPDNSLLVASKTPGMKAAEEKQKQRAEAAAADEKSRIEKEKEETRQTGIKRRRPSHDEGEESMGAAARIAAARQQEQYQQGESEENKQPETAQESEGANPDEINLDDMEEEEEEEEEEEAIAVKSIPEAVFGLGAK